MQCAHLAAGWVVALVGSTAVSAQAPSSPPVTHGAVEAAEAAGLAKKPFSRLFEQQKVAVDAAIRSRIRQDLARTDPAPRFACGMPVLPADPTIDPAFEVPPPATATRFTLRIVPPSCR